jgi:hypothetical protein
MDTATASLLYKSLCGCALLNGAPYQTPEFENYTYIIKRAIHYQDENP